MSDIINTYSFLARWKMKLNIVHLLFLKNNQIHI